MSQQTSSAAVLTLTNWQEWEGRIVGGRFPLGPFLGGTDRSAVYLTDFGGRRAVIKLIGAETPDAPAQLSRWEAARNIVHPNLLPIFETGLWHADEEQDMFYAAMEYADENLGDILKERQLTTGEAREMLAPALTALEFLHQQHLVHGDLKPANVLAVGQLLKLASDGVRRFGTRLTGTEQEDQRAAPEVFASGVSAKNDIWSIGLLVLESLTDVQAATDKNRAAAIEGLEQPFADIVRECLRPDPAKRCSIVDIREMLNRPTEPKKPEPQVASVKPETLNAPKQPDSKPVAVPAAEKKPEAAKPIVLVTEPKVTVAQPSTTRASEPKFDRNKADAAEERNLSQADFKLLLDDEPETRKSRFLPFAIAILVGLIAVVALVRLLGHSGADKPAAVTTQPAAEATSNPVPAKPTEVSQPMVRPSTGSVAHQVMPDVSRTAQNSIHGVVKVRVQLNVNESGEVALAGLAAHGPSRYFSRQALDAARQWTFTPPTTDGKPVASRWMLEFDFRRSGVKAESRMTQPRA